MCSMKPSHSTYIIMAHGVHVVFQVTFSIIRKHDSTQFSISGKMETCVCRKHQQTSDVPPANVLLGKRQRHWNVVKKKRKKKRGDASNKLDHKYWANKQCTYSTLFKTYTERSLLKRTKLSLKHIQAQIKHILLFQHQQPSYHGSLIYHSFWSYQRPNTFPHGGFFMHLNEKLCISA